MFSVYVITTYIVMLSSGSNLQPHTDVWPVGRGLMTTFLFRICLMLQGLVMVHLYCPFLLSSHVIIWPRRLKHSFVRYFLAFKHILCTHQSIELFEGFSITLTSNAYSSSSNVTPSLFKPLETGNCNSNGQYLLYDTHGNDESAFKCLAYNVKIKLN